MISPIRRLWPRPGALGKLALLHTLSALLQGLLLASFVPIFRALLQTDPDFAAATPWLIAAAIGAVAYVAVSLSTSPVTFAATTELSAGLRLRIMDHAATLPIGWFDTERKGRLSRTVTTAATAVTHLAVLFGPKTITGTIVPSIVVVVALAVDLPTGLILLVLTPVAFLARRRSAEITSRADVALEAVGTEIATRAIEFGQAQPVLRATGHGSTGTRPMAEAITRHEETYRSGMRRVQLPTLLFRAVLVAGCVAVLLLDTRRMLDGDLALADTLALLVLTVRLIETVSEIGTAGPVANAAERVLSVLDEQPLPTSPAPTSEIASPVIELDDVSFSYDDAAGPALTKVTLRLPAGSTTALVGASGSGKTTLAHLVARFHDVDSGVVRIGGVDVRDLDQAALMREIAVVFQDVYLFDDTVEANVRLGRPEATIEELEKAARASRLDEVIERLPGGWQARVGEGGAQLSGGERQRVSIARAFLKEARIVLVDEAASALDAENEAAVSRAIAELSADGDRTVVVIAHRPATLSAADRVVVLDRGRVAEFGTPQALLASGGVFARLYDQFNSARTWHISRDTTKETSRTC